MKILFDGKAVLMGIEPINLDDFPSLQVVGCNTTGTEHIDKEFEKRGIKLISLRDYPEFTKEVTSTAEHTIGLMIALMRNYKNALNEPYYERDYYLGHTLNRKTIGIIGFGRVGKQVARMAEGLGMYSLTYDVWNIPTALTHVLQESDVISIHIPLDNNEGFFTKVMFEKMKSTAYFINTSRDKIVERGALVWALENNKIAGAAVDFIDDPALEKYAEIHNELILTNHIGGRTFEDREKTENFIEEKVTEYLKK